VHHELLPFLVALAVLLGGARLIGGVASRLGLPAVVGEIIAGVVLGKTLLGRVAPELFARIFPEGTPAVMLRGYTTVAAVLLLVVAGLEIDLTVVRRSGRVALLTAFFGMIVPFWVGYGVGMALPADYLGEPEAQHTVAAFFGIALSISALPVIARTLLDLGLMKTDLGLIVMAAAVVNDLVGWVGFTVLARSFGAGEGGSLATSVGLTVLFVAVTLVVVRPVFDWLLAHLEGPQASSSGEVLSIVMVLAMLGAAATEALGMHPVFGGFVMGLAAGDSSRLREHTRATLREFVTNVFTPVFFATMALRVDFAHAFDPWLILLVLGVATIGKVTAGAAGARLGGVAWREALAIGFGMNSRGAMEILLALIALEAGIVNQRLFVALVIMAIVTSLISGPAMSRLLRPVSSPVVKLLRAGVVVLDLDAASRNEAIESLAARLAARMGQAGDAARIGAAVMTREALSSTGVGDGVAFPHAEIEGLAQPWLALARCEEGLDFDAPDGEPVRLVLLLLMPPGDYGGELQLLAAMARLMAREDLRTSLLAATGPDDVLALLETAARGDSTPPSLVAPRTTA
jgi:Kef-type K+ transport system membrane component KefB/mannitol/fructose-specific phosphotransferase system IIA component (Ntr-type)